MRKEPKTARRNGRYDDGTASYTSPPSIERYRKTLESAWENNFIAEQSPSVPARTSTRSRSPPSHMQSLCADCAIKQEPEPLYYQTIEKRPDSFGRTQVNRKEHKSRMEQQTRRGTNHIQRAMKQNLVHSTTKPKQPQGVKDKNSSIGIPTSFVRETEKMVPPGCVVGMPSFPKTVATKPKGEVEINTDDFPTVPVPVIAFQREEERRPTLGRKAVPSSLDTHFFCKRVESVVKATQRDDQQLSPTSVDDVLEELSGLQNHLDSLRLMTRPNRASSLLDDTKQADTEGNLFEFPPEETKEVVDGLSFQALESNRDVPDEAKASAFSKLVGVLAQQEPPALEESFFDEGVHIRQFGTQGDGPGAPDSPFSIVIDKEDSSPTMPKPPSKGSYRKLLKKSKSHSSLTSTRQKKMLKSSLFLKREVSAAATSQTAKVDKYKSVTSPREGPEAPPSQELDSWSPTPPYPKSRRESRGSPSTIQFPDSPRKSRKESRLSPATVQVSDPPCNKSFSIRGAFDSIRGPKVTSSTQGSPPPGIKSDRFSRKLVTSMQYRPKTLSEVMDLLYFSQEELDELEQDRDERIYEEQFEVVTGRDPREVTVTYPVRRVERQPRVEPHVEEPPGLLDISGSSSSITSDMEHPDGFY